MSLEITTGTTEELVLRLLLRKYPVTDKDVARELGLKPDVVLRVLKAFASQGVVALEPLGDVTYIRLLRRDFRFVGRSVTQKKALKHRVGKRGGKGGAGGKGGGRRPLRKKNVDPDDFSYM